MRRTLVAYFSASGVTKNLAENLSSAIDADLFEIKPMITYTKADLDWTDKKSRSSLEMSDPTSRPKIADRNINMDQYDIIYLGFPIWWYVAPMIISSFLESYDFGGKTIILFATSGGSDMGNTLNRLKQVCSDRVIWKEGRVLSARLDRDALKSWAKDAIN